MSLFRLDHKKAIITGAGSGIGKAVAFLLAQQGAEVHLVDLNKDALQQVASEIRAADGTAIVHAMDITDQYNIEAVFKTIGTINILVNSAGISHIGTIETTTEADFDRMYQVNIKGTYNCIRAAIPHIKQSGGAIINMASIASSVGIPDRFAYSMTKGAVVGMTLSVAKDYLAYNIRCNCISPARVHTPFVDNFLAKTYPGEEATMFEKLSRTQPIGRMGQPVEIAHLVLYLSSDEASFITGTDYPIDGGFIRLNN